MQLKLKEDPREWRKFTLTVLPAPALLGLGLWWKRGLATPWLVVWLGGLACVAVLAIARPRWFRGFYRLGSSAGYHLARSLGWLALTLVFFLGVMPLGLVLQWLGHDPLQLRRRPQAESYWRPVRSRADLGRMF